MPSRGLLEKTREVEEIKSLFEKHKVVGVASLQKVRAAQLQELKRKLGNDVYLRVVKNTVLKRAIRKCEDMPRISELERHLGGSNIFLFTDLNPFKLALLLEKNKVITTAKAGDVAAWDVVVPAGNTGLPPGPVISQLGTIGLPTRIEAGSVWITRDTKVADKGEIMDARMATVLSKLGIKPVEIGLVMKTAYDEGVIVTEEQMRPNLEEVQRRIGEAHTRAFNLSLNITYVTPENIDFLLQLVQYEAWKLALDAVIFNEFTVKDIIRKAHLEMMTLYTLSESKN